MEGLTAKWAFLVAQTLSLAKHTHAVRTCTDAITYATSECSVDEDTGIAEIIVYRAANSESDYAGHLLNADAADAGGVLSYLHTEIIPRDQSSCDPTKEYEANMGASETEKYSRKYGIDVVFKFRVQVFNSCSACIASDDFTPPEDGYFAYDSGECTDPGCEAHYKEYGYNVGQQTQNNAADSDLVRAWYGRGTAQPANWFSFPQAGYCNSPTGEDDCTYSFQYIGKIELNDLVNSGATSTDDETGYIDGTYKEWCKAGCVDGTCKDFTSAAANNHIEAERNTDASGDCTDVDCWCTTTSTLPFWEGVCESAACNERTETLQGFAFDYTLENGCDASDCADLSKECKSLLNAGACVSSCDVGMYVTWDWECASCPQAHCGSCANSVSPDGPSETCYSCTTGYFQTSNASDFSCVSSTGCGSGDYPNSATGICESCSSASTADYNAFCTGGSGGGGGGLSAGAAAGVAFAVIAVVAAGGFFVWRSYRKPGGDQSRSLLQLPADDEHPGTDYEKF